MPPQPVDAATPADVPAASVLSKRDCQALIAAPALGFAVVKSTQSDCSSVGHVRIVLEVTSLVRGEAITTVTTSRPLYGRADKLAAGDTVIVGIDPGVHVAEKVYCVQLPERQGTARDVVRVDADQNVRVLAELAAGCTL